MKRGGGSASTRGRIIRSHQALAFICIVLVAVTIMAGLLVYEINSALDTLASRAASIARFEQRAARDGDAAPDITPWEFEDMADASICMLDAQGQLLNSSSADDMAEDGEALWALERRLSGIGPGQMAELLGGANITSPRTIGLYLKPRSLVYAAAPVWDDAETVIGAILLIAPVHRLDSLYRFIIGVALTMLVFCLVIAVFMARYQAQWITRPVVTLCDQAEQMMEGNYAQFTYPETSDEISRIGNTMNVLAQKLDDTIKTLVASREQLELVLSSIGEGILAVDVEGNPIHWNDTLLSLLELGSIDELFVAGRDDLRRLCEACQEAARKGTETSMGNTNLSGRQLAADVHPLWRDGELAGSLCVLRDVSEAEELEASRRRYVANISHELRTPLTGIRGLIEPLIDGYIETEEEKRECYQVILSETERLQKLVGEMLDLSRLESDTAALEMEAMDIRDAVASSVRNASVLARQKGLTLEMKLPDEPVICMANESRVRQLLLIFVDNAVKYTETGGRIEVSVSRDDWQGIVRVADSGCGIPPEALPHIWERFYKADQSRSRTKGTGIGLSIAKLLVDRMGGAAHAVSSVGEGSEFSFTLPLAFCHGKGVELADAPVVQ